jgi:hypothetical protein
VRCGVFFAAAPVAIFCNLRAGTRRIASNVEHCSPVDRQSAATSQVRQPFTPQINVSNVSAVVIWGHGASRRDADAAGAEHLRSTFRWPVQALSTVRRSCGALAARVQVRRARDAPHTGRATPPQDSCGCCRTTDRTCLVSPHRPAALSSTKPPSCCAGAGKRRAPCFTTWNSRQSSCTAPTDAATGARVCVRVCVAVCRCLSGVSVGAGLSGGTCRRTRTHTGARALCLPPKAPRNIPSPQQQVLRVNPPRDRHTLRAPGGRRHALPVLARAAAVLRVLQRGSGVRHFGPALAGRRRVHRAGVPACSCSRLCACLRCVLLQERRVAASPAPRPVKHSSRRAWRRAQAQGCSPPEDTPPQSHTHALAPPPLLLPTVSRAHTHR